MSKIFHGDCFDLLEQMEPVPLIIADVPDNLGLKYGKYVDRRHDYYSWLIYVIEKALDKTDCFWLSYYWKHDLRIKHDVFELLIKRPHVSVKTFIWRFNFGQHNQYDFGSGFRYLLRFTKPNAKFNPDAVRIISKRQALGDSRADPRGRVPDDVFDFPRVTGNSKERRKWIPTQHPEALIRRIILMHSDPDDLVIDLFGGSGTTLRVALSNERRVIVSEIDPEYCRMMSIETGLPIVEKLKS